MAVHADVPVPCGGDVDDPACGDVCDRLADRSALPHRVLRVGHVVDDDGGSGSFCECPDVVGERIFAVERRCEGEMRAGCKVMNDLRHRPALVGAEGAFVEDTDGRGVAARVPGSG